MDATAGLWPGFHSLSEARVPQVMGHDPQVMGVGVTGANLVPFVSFFLQTLFPTTPGVIFSNYRSDHPTLPYHPRLKKSLCLVTTEHMPTFQAWLQRPGTPWPRLFSVSPPTCTLWPSLSLHFPNPAVPVRLLCFCAYTVLPAWNTLPHCISFLWLL